MTNNDNLTTKESKVNINMRVKESLKNKIKDTLETESKTPDELFSQMFLAYLKEQATTKGEADYSSDIQELNNVIGRISTIFQNMIEKTYMQNSISKDKMLSEIENTKKDITDKYEKEISILIKERDSIKKEYAMIAEQATALLSDTKKLKEMSNSLKETNLKNEELLKTYKEQILSLKESNKQLKNQLENSIDVSLLDKEEIKRDKALLEKDKYYQEIINSMQENYKELQLKYTKLIEDKISNKK